MSYYNKFIFNIIFLAAKLQSTTSYVTHHPEYIRSRVQND